MGIGEQNMASVAAGLAAEGKIPFIASYAMFSPGRNWEQIRTTIALNEVPVKIAGAHAGISVGQDGATHQQLEDIALMRAMPKMTVVYPGDSIEARKATLAAASYEGPVYLRFAREKTAVFTKKYYNLLIITIFHRITQQFTQSLNQVYKESIFIFMFLLTLFQLFFQLLNFTGHMKHNFFNLGFVFFLLLC